MSEHSDDVSTAPNDPVPEDGGPDHGLARDTEVSESDPNADSAQGLAGGMGVSSERVGPASGESDVVSYGVRETHHPAPSPDAAPEQSADPGAGEPVQPDQPVLKEHPVEDPEKRGTAGLEGGG